MKSAAKERLIVIGNGMAGAASVDEIVKLDPLRYAITVYGAEKSADYNRVLLSHILTGDKDLNAIRMRDAAWYEKNGVALHTGSKIVSIKRKSRVLVAEDGTEATYNKLVIATGALPVMPDIPGIDKKGVTAFRNIEDCERIKRAVSSAPDKKVVVIGGGLLGLEAAYALKRMGAEVTVIHLA
ncbi:NAD(P)/FAD-dependent oxidoreductase, partial [bacterium]